MNDRMDYRQGGHVGCGSLVGIDGYADCGPDLSNTVMTHEGR
jgi:hypothetical protein